MTMPALGSPEALAIGEADCPFCALFRGDDAPPPGRQAIAIPDGFPLNPGHHLVIPRRHEADFFALTPAEMAAVMSLVSETRTRIERDHRPDGFNVGVNVGHAGGQTIGHVHVHVIPRFEGDVADPRGGVRWLIPDRAVYWESGSDR